MRNSFLSILLLLLTLLSQSPLALSYVFKGDYLPLAPKTLGRPFPITSVTQDASDNDFSKLPSYVKGHVDKDGLHLSGHTKKKRSWELCIPKTDLWKGDLDGNGKEDIIALLFTGACGIAPSTYAITVLFDDQLSPHVYEMTGYFVGNAGTIEDLRKLDRLKEAVFIDQLLTDYGSNSYWRTTAYRCHNCNWTKLTQLNGVSLPAYTLYSFHRPNHETARSRIYAEDPSGVMKPFSGDEKFGQYLRFSPTKASE